MILPHAHMPCAKKTREFRKPHEPTLEDCHGDGKWAPLRDVFGRVTKSYLENLVELSPELMKVIEMGITCRATCGFDGVSEKMSYKQYKYLLKFAGTAHRSRCYIYIAKP